MQPAGRPHIQVSGVYFTSHLVPYSQSDVTSDHLFPLLIGWFVFLCSDVTVELPLLLMHPKPTGIIDNSHKRILDLSVLYLLDASEPFSNDLTFFLPFTSTCLPI